MELSLALALFACAEEEQEPAVVVENLDALVLGVRYVDPAVLRDRKALRAFELARPGAERAPLAQEIAIGIQNLDALVL